MAIYMQTLKKCTKTIISLFLCENIALYFQNLFKYTPKHIKRSMFSKFLHQLTSP